MIRAVIADDSALMRQVLQDMFAESKEVTVVASAKNGKEAIQFVKEHSPDILVLDVEMPVMNGLEALSIIMKECPLPVFMFSSLTREGSAVTIKALEYGAVDFLLKPLGGALSIDKVADDLIDKVKAVVAQKKKHRAAPTAKGAGEIKKTEPKILQQRHIDIIAMGSSTGGVQAAMEVVPKLPAHTKPLVWVQHMPPNFTKSFAQRLDGVSQMRVKEAEDGDVIQQGMCYLARGGVQMFLQKRASQYVLKLQGDQKVSGHCPSCNVLFDSVAEYFSQNVIGIILTGMGDDGTKGLVKMHDKGAYVIGQSEESCVVYGMPRAAYAAGAVDVEYDIKDIAAMVVKAGGA